MSGESESRVERQPDVECQRYWVPVEAPLWRREPKSVQEPVREPVSPSNGGESDE